jgi:hypothetical protein
MRLFSFLLGTIVKYRAHATAIEPYIPMQSQKITAVP